MTASTSNWANWAAQLQTSLVFWSEGRTSLCGKGLQQVVAQLQGPAMAVWRALVFNQLALLSSQLGHWDYSKEQWELAQESWRESGLVGGSPELAPTLQWFCQLLKEAGFPERSDLVWQLHESGQPPLLDPWSVPDTGSDFASLQPPTLGSSPVPPNTQQHEYAPLGGQTLSSVPQAQPGRVQRCEWDQAVERALKQALEGKLQPALANLDQAREVAVALRPTDRGHLLALIYNAEALACFLAGDYSSATQARQEGQRIWGEMRVTPAVYQGDTHDRFAAALREAQQDRAADVFLQRHQQRQCPLVDPWADLESGLQRGEWEQVKLDLVKDWKPKLDSVLQHFSRGNSQEAVKELGLVQQRMTVHEMAGPAGCMLLQVQSLLAYAAGDYDNAQALFAKAKIQWDAVPSSKRREGPFLEQTRALLTMYGLESIADHLGDSLCDPFLYYKPEHQMQRIESNEVAEEEGDPRERWETQLKEAWELARGGRFELAQRRANHAERVARLISADDLRVCYSLNSQAVFAQAAGNYGDAASIFAEAERAWKRGARTTTARTAWTEFCTILTESDWPDLGAQLEKAWDKPVSRSAYDPALLPLECLSNTGMQVMRAAVPEVQDANVLRLPTASKDTRLEANSEAPSSKLPLILALLLVLALASGGVWWVKFRGAPTPPSSKVITTPQ